MKHTILMAMFMLLIGVTAYGQRGESREIADRIRNDGARAENRGDRQGAREARDAANRAERSTPERAREIERSYNRGDRSEGPGRGPAGGRN